MDDEKNLIYEFDSYRLDSAERRLTRGGEIVQLPPKAFETLLVLIENNGHLVEKEALMNRVWADSFVEEGNLKLCVHTLRKILKGSNFIETIPKKGYRFNAPVRLIEKKPNDFTIEKQTVSKITIEAAENDEPEKLLAAAPKSFVHNSPKSKIYLVSFLLLALALGAGLAIFQSQKKSFGAFQNDRQGANEAFEKGNEFLQKRETCKDIPYFREAADRDKTFARAYTNLAAALAMCGDKKTEAEDAIAHSLALDPNSAEANATDGFIKMFRHWDWDGAETALRRAAALDPNSVKAHHWLAVNLSIRGRFGEAVAGEMRRAIEIEPNSAPLHADLCQILYLERNYGAAIGECHKASEIDPNFILTPQYLHNVYLVTGDEKSAIEQQLKFFTLAGATPEDVKKAAETFEREGFKGWARKSLEDNRARFNPNQVKGEDRLEFSNLSLDYYVTLNDKDNALFCLENLVNCQDCVRSFWLPYVAVDPRYNFLRDDARFQAILRKMNLE
ncbi:MAG: winged helix-turn-helix domain-containing protein [Pyrinomonadaceae bacterium]